MRHSIDDDLSGLAAELAYRASLALFPFLLVLAALPSVAGSVLGVQDIPEQLADKAHSLLSDNSAEMMQTLIDEVSKSQGWMPLLIGLSGVLWAGTSATSTLRKALNRIYRFDDDTPFFKRKLTEVGLTCLAGMLFVAAVTCIVIGPSLMGAVNPLTQLASLAMSFVLILIAVSVLYWLAPAGESTYRWVTPGALVFGVAWIVFTFLFSAYLSVSGTLNHVYGTLGVVIAMLIWLYGSNMVLLFGAELNATLAHQLDEGVRKDSVEDRS